MFGRSWQICRLFGIPVSIHPSWLIIVALATFSLTSLFRQLLGDHLPDYAYWILGLGTVLAFFVCILLHEMGHALVAKKQGIPIRGITLFLFGGVAQMESEPPSAAKEFWMAIAGPIVSLVLGLTFWGLAWSGWFLNWDPAAIWTLNILTYINIFVLIFNMVPAFPLDGGRVLRSILWGITGSLRRATYWSSLSGQFFAWFLIGMGLLSLFLTGNFLSAIWLGLIGLFLLSAAQMGYQQVLIRQALEGEPIRRFMNPDPITVPPHISLYDWVENYVYNYHHKGYPVTDNGHLHGFITTRALSKYPRSEWSQYMVSDVMKTDVDDITISPQADALEAFERMQRTDSSRLLVMENDQLLGIISLKDLMRFLQLKLELEGDEDDRSPRDPYPRYRDERQTTAHYR